MPTVEDIQVLEWLGFLDDANFCACNHNTYVNKDSSLFSAQRIFLAPLWATTSVHPTLERSPNLLLTELQINIWKYFPLATAYSTWSKSSVELR